MTSPKQARTSLADDPLLATVPVVDGRKVLAPAVLHSKLGQGGMGAVYRGKHLELGIEVAVKCLKPSLMDESGRFEARFYREAHIAAKLSHQNLVRLYEIRRAHGLLYLILEYVEGETAHERVARKGPLREEDAARILLAASRGLAVAHRHSEVIVHRDVKPANILISKRGEVKLADLGLAKAQARDGETTFTTEGIVGTPHYMAPEQWDPDQMPTPRSDVWGMGATLYFLLTGRNAMRGTSVNQILHEVVNGTFPDPRLARADLSQDIARIVERCTQKEPEKRYADAAALAKDLQDFLRTRSRPLLRGSSDGLYPTRRAWLRAAGVGAIGIAGALLWKRPRGAAQTASAGHREYVTSTASRWEPSTGCQVPEEWEVVDGAPGYDDWANSVREPKSGIEFLLVAPGTFLMGSPAREAGRGRDEKQHEVQITRPFYLAVTETTCGQLAQLFQNLEEEKSLGEEFERLPLTNLAWATAQRLCHAIDCDLPTEAQWEFAARGGERARFWWGDSPADGKGKGNFLDLGIDPRPPGEEPFPFEDDYAGAAPVRSFAQNPLGFWDILGNVWEWCLDEYREDYEAIPGPDPLEPPGAGRGVLRGGSWLSGVASCRVARRLMSWRSQAREDFGFRAARTLY